MPTLRRLAQNWKLKLLALALAVLLWIVVSADQVTSNWIPVPLEVRVLDPSYRLRDGSAPREVEVRFTGPGRDFLDLAIRRSPLQLNIAEVSDTQEVFNLEPGMVQVPNQLSVNPQDVRPGRVSLRFLRLEDRLVPVRVRVRNELGSEWTLVDSLRVEPARVRVRGPLSQLEDIEYISSRPITLSPGDSSFSRLVQLDTTALTGVRISSPSVRVSGTVDRVRESTVEDVPVSIGGGVRVRPTSVDVRLKGPEQIVRTLSADGLRAVVAIDSIPGRIPEEGVSVPIRVETLPAGVTAEAVPPSVRLFPAVVEATPDTVAAVPRDTTAAAPAGAGG